MAKYHTPLVLRTGFLHSVRRTLPFLLVWTAVTEAILAASGVFIESLLDPWTYLFYPICFSLIYLTRRTVSGFNDLFGVLDEDFQRSSLNLYGPLDVGSRRREQSGIQERIRLIFSEDDKSYDTYKEEIRRFVFGRYEKYLPLAVVFIVGPFQLIFGLYAYSQVGLYGVVISPWWQLFVVVNAVFGTVMASHLVSIFYIVATMIFSISLLDRHRENMKIHRYLRLLKGDTIEQAEQVMGYDSFYENTKPIGSFLYGLTWRTLAVVVVYALNVVLFSFLLELDPGFTYLLGFAIVGATVVMFLWPQLGLHGLLMRMKSDIFYALITKRDHLYSQIIVKSAHISGSGESEHISAEVDVHIKALQQVDAILERVKNRSTWGFDYITMLKLFGGSATPLILSAIRDLAASQGWIP